MSCELVDELGAEIALGLADPAEVARVEAHAATCPACARQLAELREAVTLLALSVPQVAPPPRLRTRILSEAVRVRPPTARAGTERRWLPTGAAPVWAGLAAGFAALALGLLLWTLNLQAQLDRQMAAYERIEQSYNHIVQVLAASNFEVRELVGTSGAPAAFGRVYVDPATGRGMLMTHNLPRAGEGSVYQIWLVRGEQRVPGGFLWVREDGIGYGLFRSPEGAWSYDAVGVTKEPAGGSPQPTGPRLLVSVF